ncbi:MAG: hypothetical protein EOO02_09330 [Chitinophagaceae bacterium]|nr:MAG: hypothetical protein EOO02_09330 [Chitinophagaceae bacterium]
MRNPILFLSFLRAIRQRNKIAWGIIIALGVMQLVFTAIRLEATPFFLFGMFSEKMKATDSLTTLKVFVNGKDIGTFHPSLREYQLLETTTGNYIEMKRNGSIDPVKTRIESRYPLIYNSPVYPVLSGRLYNTPESMPAFRQWLKKKSLRIADIETGIVQIVLSTYVFNKTSTVPTSITYETLETF